MTLLPPHRQGIRVSQTHVYCNNGFCEASITEEQKKNYAHTCKQTQIECLTVLQIKKEGKNLLDFFGKEEEESDPEPESLADRLKKKTGITSPTVAQPVSNGDVKQEVKEKKKRGTGILYVNF